MDINNLPPEILMLIMKKIDADSLETCRCVSKKWKEVIEDNNYIWERLCLKEFYYPSIIAKKKSGDDCKWYNIYKNMKMWQRVGSVNYYEWFKINIREFYKFSLNDKNRALAIDYGVLPVRDARGILLYDARSLKYIPVAIPETNCLKIANNDIATVFLLKSGILIQRTVDNLTFMTEAFFKADNFVLDGEELYFVNNRDVYKCDLSLENLEYTLMLHCDYDIKEIQCSNSNVYIFTDSGKIVTILKNGMVSVKSINCPSEWVKQIKHIAVINDKNFICYSRNLFKVETDVSEHLYLGFPHITCLFFYGDFVLIGTRAGEILLYRLSIQKQGENPKLHRLAVLPERKFAVQLDVCERKNGPVIVVATYFEIILVEIIFFPHVSILTKIWLSSYSNFKFI